MEQSRIYPLAQKDNPPAMKFPNASGVPANCDFKRDLRYFESLAAFINHEAVAPEDMAMRGMAASLGIVKGQPFRPDAKMKAMLNVAGDVAFKIAAVDSYDTRYPNKLICPDRKCWVIPFPGRQHCLPAEHLPRLGRVYLLLPQGLLDQPRHDGRDAGQRLAVSSRLSRCGW
jgi:hypothetical protein